MKWQLHDIGDLGSLYLVTVLHLHCSSHLVSAGVTPVWLLAELQPTGKEGKKARMPLLGSGLRNCTYDFYSSH